MPPIISVICSLFYFLPWIIEPRAGLGFYIIAFLWFLLAWIPMFLHIAVGVRSRIRNHLVLSNRHFFSALTIFVSYVIVMAGILNGYTVSV